MYNSKKNKNSNKAVEIIKSELPGCKLITADSYVNLNKFEYVFIISSNIGDEEIPENIENYVMKTKTKNKKYFLCELGNYLGLDYSGCGESIKKILKTKNWILESEIRLDSYPKLEKKKIKPWIQACKKKINKII